MISIQKATCISTGVAYYECDCGKNRIEVLPISAENHNEIPLWGYAATCTKTGLADGKQCSLCGKTTKEQEPIKALGHDEEIIKGYAATCTATGLTDGKKCARCDDVIVAQTTIDAIGHSYTDDETRKYCTLCGHEVATWVMVEDWTQKVLTAGKDEKIITRPSTVTKYRYYSCMFWSNNRLDIVSASEANAKQYATWNGIWLSNTSWREIGESVCTGVFAAGKQGESNGTYVKVATGYYDSPQNPMPNCIDNSPCFNEERKEVDVTYYQKWRLVYKEQ